VAWSACDLAQFYGVLKRSWHSNCTWPVVVSIAELVGDIMESRRVEVFRSVVNNMILCSLQRPLRNILRTKKELISSFILCNATCNQRPSKGVLNRPQSLPLSISTLLFLPFRHLKEEPIRRCLIYHDISNTYLVSVFFIKIFDILEDFQDPLFDLFNLLLLNGLQLSIWYPIPVDNDLIRDTLHIASKFLDCKS